MNFVASIVFAVLGAVFHRARASSREAIFACLRDFARR